MSDATLLWTNELDNLRRRLAEMARDKFQQRPMRWTLVIDFSLFLAR